MKLKSRWFLNVIGMISISMVLLKGSEVPGAKQDASEIVKRVRNTLDNIKTFSCRFESEQVWKVAERTQHVTGTVYMKMGKTYMLRIERPEQIIVNDGKTVWSYIPKNNQVQISDSEGDSENFPSPHNIFKQYAEKREVILSGKEKVNSSDCDVLSLVSQDPDEARVTVWIDINLHFPVKAREETATGDVTTHTLSDVRLKEKIDDRIFSFVPPEGVSVIDMRE